MTGAQALIYARSRHRAAGGDFDRGRRQQRVLLSLREQMNAQAIVANLPVARQRAQAVDQDRHPDLAAAQAPRARGERRHPRHPLVRVLADASTRPSTSTRRAATSSRPTSPASAPRSATRSAVSPDLLAQRERLGLGGGGGLALQRVQPAGLVDPRRRLPDLLRPRGVSAQQEASRARAHRPGSSSTTAPRRRCPRRSSTSRSCTARRCKTATDPSVTVDIIVTLGQNAPGPLGRRGRLTRAGGRRPLSAGRS